MHAMRFVPAVPIIQKERGNEQGAKAAGQFKSCDLMRVVEKYVAVFPDDAGPSCQRAVLAKTGGKVATGWMDRVTRYATLDKALHDPQMAAPCMPLSGKRLNYDGFETLLGV